MLKTIYKRGYLYFTWLILVFIIALGVVTNAVLPLGAFVILLSALLFFSLNDAIVLLVALVPFANVFKISTASTSLFTVAEMFLVLLLVLKIKKIKASIFISVLLLAAYMLSFSVANMNLLLIVKISIGFLLTYYSMQILSKNDVKNITYLLSFGIIIMMVLTLNARYLGYVIPYYEDLNYLVTSSGVLTDTVRASGFLGDPNYCAVMIVIALSMLSLLYYYKYIGNLFWLLFVTIAILGFFTYSKSYFLCLSALILFLFLAVLLPMHKGFAVFGILALAVVIFMIVNGRFEVVNALLERFKDSDVTTGRSDLNSNYLQYIFNDFYVLLFGKGISANHIAEFGHIVHNSYIELLYRMGLIGSALYLSCTVLASKKYIYNREDKSKIKFVNIMPLMFFCVMFFALAGVTRYETPIYLIIVFLGLNFNKLSEKATETAVISLK